MKASWFRTQAMPNIIHNSNQEQNERINIDTESLTLVNNMLVKGVPKMP